MYAGPPCIKGHFMYKGSILYTTDSYNIRVDFMYVGVAWVHPWLIALEGDYVGVAWVCPWLIALEDYIRSTLI